MYLTTRNCNNIFDEMFRSPFFNMRNDTVRKPAETVRAMKTNVQENENGYLMEIDLPGYEKENIKAELKDGYLTITAEKSENSEKNENGKYIRRECYRGTQKRSFYVGEYLKQEDIQAAYKNGVLQLNIPKEKPPVEEPAKLITIE